MQPSLAEQQRAMAARILGHEEGALEAWLVVPEGVDIATRLAVYTQGYPARIAESLREAFPATAHILGDGSFASLTERYLAQVPAAQRNLNYVGSALPELLKSDPLADELPFLPDLARLEWAVTQCFHGDPADPLDTSQCATWSMDDWASARIGFQPHMDLVCSAWPLSDLREARHTDRPDIDVDLVDRSDHVLVYRDGFEVVEESVDETEATAIQQLRAGGDLGEVTASLAAAGVRAETVNTLFGRWVSVGLVASCEPCPFSTSVCRSEIPA
jgi:hypothetical protein